jgi:hypothetical protein
MSRVKQLGEFGSGVLAVVSAASFNNVCAGLAAIGMLIYYIRKDIRETRNGRNDSAPPIHRK